MARQSLNLPYLLLTGVFIVGIAVTFIVVRPMYGTWQQKRVELNDLQARVAERQSFLQTIDQRKAELARQQDSEKVLQVVLPPDNASDDVTRLLQRLATSSGVAITNVAVNSSDEASLQAARARGQVVDIPESVLPVSFSVQLTGNYQQFRNFSEQLDRAIRLADVQSVEIKRDQNQPELMIVKLEARFYKYQPESKSNGQ